MEGNKPVWIAATILILFLTIVGGSVVTGGLMLGIISTIGAILVYKQLPTFLKKILSRFHIIVDIALGILVFKIFGGKTATALIGASVNSILLSFYLMYQKKLYGGDNTTSEEIDIREMILKLK